MPTSDEREELRRVRRERTAEREARNNPTPTTTPSTTPQYNYSDPGRFGAGGYSYQVGDEFSSPGPEPPRDSPEWPGWKKHAAAWRNFIGGRQQYVNQMIGAGYNPEDLGITPRKEEGRAGYNRLMQPGVIDQLRADSARYMTGTDAEIDPTTGLYVTGQPGAYSYYDTRGMNVDARGRPTGRGIYGGGNTQAQFGANAIPRTAPSGYNAPARTARPTSTIAPTTAAPPTAPVSTLSSNYQGFGQAYGAGSIPPAYRNRRPRRQYVSSTYAQSPFGI